MVDQAPRFNGSPITVGIDLASSDRNTAACAITWGHDRPRLTLLQGRDVTDDRIVTLARGAQVIGIDAPFGWPEAFTAATASYAAGAAWPRKKPDGLWLRLTDERAWVATGKLPLSVSSDRIARAAERAARLLTLLGTGDQAARRDGSDNVIEVYPAGALRCWGIATAGYKQPAGYPEREDIVTTIEEALALEVPDEARPALVATDHAVDALVAAIVARAFQVKQVLMPTTDEVDAARKEGWLYLPSGSLSTMR